MRRPGIERIFTPTLSSLDQIEAACRGHSQREKEIGGLGGSLDLRAGRLSARKLPCDRYSARTSHLFVDLPRRQDLVSSCLRLTILGNKLRKLASLGTAPADLVKHAPESNAIEGAESRAQPFVSKEAEKPPISQHVVYGLRGAWQRFFQRFE